MSTEKEIKRNKFVKALDLLLKEMSQAELAAKTPGVGQGRISQIVNGKYQPGFVVQTKIAKAAGFEDLQDFLNRMLPPPSISEISGPIQFLKAPIIDAGAGELSGYIQNWRDYEVGEDEDFIPVTAQEKSLGTFGVRVNGDSMSPTIKPGDIAVCVPTRSIDNGKIVLACWPGSEADPGKCLIKRYMADERGNVTLWSDNPEHEPIVLTKREIREVHLCRVTKLIKEV